MNRIIADSIAPSGRRITTWLLDDLSITDLTALTRHRALSWSVQSTRIMSPHALNTACEFNPLMPDTWYAPPAEGSKMSRGEILPEEMQDLCKDIVLKAAHDACKAHAALIRAGVHPELANVYLLPYLRYTSVVTATEWRGFYAQRAIADNCGHGPRRDLRLRALDMKRQYAKHEPEELSAGAWHLPFVTDQERQSTTDIIGLVRLSMARCARTSTGKEGEGDARLVKWLLSQIPMHVGPAEHVAMALFEPNRRANLVGWQGYRSMIPGEANGDYEGIVT